MCACISVSTSLPSPDVPPSPPCCCARPSPPLPPALPHTLHAQVGHALVSTAVAKLLPGSASVQKLSIIPRTGGALGFTYIPPNTEDRALMFDR